MTTKEFKKNTTLENVVGGMGILSILLFGCIMATVHHLSVNDVHKQLAATWNIESTISSSTKPRDIVAIIKHGIPDFWILSPCDEIGLNNLAIDPCDIRPAMLALVRQYNPDVQIGQANAQYIKRILEDMNSRFNRSEVTGNTKNS